MMTASMLDALAGVGYLGLICTTFLLLPKIWRPEILFGVAVRDQAGLEMGLRALRYWNKRVLLLATTAAGCTILLALFLRRPWPFIPAGGFLASAALAYVRARRMVLPFSRTTSNVGTVLRQRRYRDYLSPWWEALPIALFALGTVLTWAVLFRLSEVNLRFHAKSIADLLVQDRVSTIAVAIFCTFPMYPLV